MTRALICGCLVLVAGCTGAALTVWEEDQDVVIAWQGEDFATVHTDAQPRPYVWPLVAPGGVAVTRNHPMGAREGEQHDHPHHQSLWFAHGDVNGFDFWHGRDRRERIVREEAETRYLAAGVVEVDASYRWQVDDGDVVLREQRVLRFEDRGDHRTVDATITLRASDGDVTFGDTKEGTFALRLHPALRVEGKLAAGVLSNSEGDAGKAAWGKRARWLHDQGPVDGEPVGVAIFDHPDNLRHPTWWHARTYGLVAANPFGVHDFERQPAGAGDLVLAQGDELTLRYRVVMHRGAWTAERVEQEWRRWAR
jgi:hypothetical protein